MSYRTLQSVRQAVFALFTTPELSYVINDGPTQYLPAANIQPYAPWNLADSPPANPLVCFTVTGMGIESKQLAGRYVGLKIWVSGSQDSDLVTEIYEALRARLMPDGDLGDGVVSWDRPAVTGQPTGSNTLGVVIRSCRETHASMPEVEPSTIRWWMTAGYTLYAV